MDNAQQTTCRLCGGSKRLSQKGILVIYLLPHIVWVFFMVVAAVLGIVHSRYWFIIAGAAYIVPLVQADLRLLLYPVAAVASLFGAKVNCPKCEPHGGVFRRF
ncbi:MAG: hypothetical protein HZC28_04340 [Spirochaetes bacterium]|nr:hypothetical protein [Spirochaetota bacterium]